MEDVKVYMVVNLDIEDKDTYLKYEKGFFPMLKKHGGEFLTFDDSFRHIEGPEPLAGGRVIIFSFPSEEASVWFLWGGGRGVLLSTDGWQSGIRVHP